MYSDIKVAVSQVSANEYQLPTLSWKVLGGISLVAVAAIGAVYFLKSGRMSS